MINGPTSNWLVLNNRKIDKILRECEIYNMRGEYGGINLREIVRIIKGAKEEIGILSRKIERFELEKIKKESEIKTGSSQ